MKLNIFLTILTVILTIADQSLSYAEWPVPSVPIAPAAIQPPDLNHHNLDPLPLAPIPTSSQPLIPPASLATSSSNNNNNNINDTTTVSNTTSASNSTTKTTTITSTATTNPITSASTASVIERSPTATTITTTTTTSAPQIVNNDSLAPSDDDRLPRARIRPPDHARQLIDLQPPTPVVKPVDSINEHDQNPPVRDSSATSRSELLNANPPAVMAVPVAPMMPAMPPQGASAKLQEQPPDLLLPSSSSTSESIAPPAPGVVTDSDSRITQPRVPDQTRRLEESATSASEVATSPAAASVTPRPRINDPARRPEESSRQATGGPLSPVQFLRPKSKFKCQNTSDCHNGGVCTNETCFCAPGFTGESCSININECRQEQEPCLNNGTCIDGINEFRCECIPGYRGDFCHEAIDMCEQSPCQNGALCINHRVNYTCECELGWEGKHCERNIDECLRGPCQNNATCYDLTNDYRCDCASSGYTGKNCDIDIDDCAAKPCSYGAKECIDMLGDFRCICHDGFEGKRCEEDIDECRTNPCENNSTCIEKSLHLRHLHNFSATPDLAGSLLAHDIRELNLSSAATSGNFSQLAGYTCECKEEFYGDRCEEKKKCYTKSVMELCGHLQAECQNVGGSYDCVISSSFDGSGHNYASLRVNSEFKMREIYVKYRSLTGGIIMSFETSQAETPNVDLQLNKSGLYLGGNPIKRDDSIKFEELLDGNEREIRLGLDTPTEIKSITLARSQASLAHIAPVATGSHVAAAAANSLVVVDHYPAFKGCLMQVKLNNQLIPFIEYGNQPLANNSSSSGGSTFELLDKHLEVGMCRTCFEQDCKNHGSCETQDGYDHCSCTENFTGTFCEEDVNECQRNSNLCLNSGVCENLHGSYRCNCKDGYRGEKCAEIADYCKAKQPCITGTCKNVSPSQGTFQCECPSTHFGKRCEKRRDCNNDCLLGSHAHCVNNVTCACLPGRRDERTMCEYVARCEQIEGELCRNGGRCINLEAGGYHCACEEPFQGPICHTRRAEPQFSVLLVLGILAALCTLILVIGLTTYTVKSVRKARATRGTYSPSTQEKFGNSASDLLKAPQPERLI